MSPNDPRHGQYAGGNVHRADGEKPCEPCRLAENRYENQLQLDRAAGRRRLVDGTGSSRRIGALIALGHDLRILGRELGISRQALRQICDRPVVRASTAARIVEVYDRLSMQLPDASTSLARRNASYARTVARRHGWPPPLAWPDDRIDDPSYQPGAWQYAPADRATRLAEYDADGLGISEVCRRLDITRDALQQWCGRERLSPLYRRLSNREDGMDADRKRGAA